MDTVRVTIDDITINVSEENYNTARDALTAHKTRNGYRDRFTKPDTWIVSLIASKFQREGKVTNVNGLINSLVDVPGKGWTSY